MVILSVPVKTRHFEGNFGVSRTLEWCQKTVIFPQKLLLTTIAIVKISRKVMFDNTLTIPTTLGL